MEGAAHPPCGIKIMIRIKIAVEYVCVVVVFFAVFLFDARPALAHVDHGEATGFFTGLEHPWSGLDHIVAMLAVGLWGAQLGQPAIWLLPIVFPMVMSLGAFCGLIGIPVPGVEAGIALSGIVLGVMVFAEVKPPVAVAALLVGIFAIFHGHAHGTELPEGQSGLLYSFGFVIGTGLLHAVGIAIGLIHHWPVGARVIRVTGVFIAVTGAFFFVESSHVKDGRALFSDSAVPCMPMGPFVRAILALTLVLACPSIANAHLVTTGLGPIYDGIGHLLLTPQDLLAVLALCLFAGLRGPEHSRKVLFLLPPVWFLAGTVLGSWFTGFGSFPLAAVSFIVLGLLVAADLRVDPSGVGILSILFGTVHGLDNGVAMRAGAGWLGLLGIMAGLFVVVAIATAIVISLERPWTRIVIRVLGSWIVATGIMMLGWHYRPDQNVEQVHAVAVSTSLPVATLGSGTTETATRLLPGQRRSRTERRCRHSATRASC